MTSERWRQVQHIFAEASDLAESERAGFLDAACGTDLDLRREIESLFAHDQTRSPLDDALRAAHASFVAREEMTGRRLGAYRIVKQIGAGGMGVVYLAVRDDAQFEKRVAIKLVRNGMDLQSVVDRFRHERQILAQLEHPYVAKLLDGGSTDDGAPYFIMEYVEGTPITDYCASHNFTVEQKCDLFLKVCEAVSYAHRNLVIHRDLKPSNILITGEGIPKLLDFGIAKVLTPDSGNITMALTQQAMPLTPDYASPEQLHGGPFNTTTDVYSLGAVFFEMMTASRPHQLTGFTPTELERAICTEEIRKPSSATASAAVGRRLAGDIDNIILMAMRKEPERRYQSVVEFREDVQRHLRGLPVVAREDSALYRSSKFLRRHRVGAIAAGMIFLAMSAGIVSTNHERRIAEAQREMAETQRHNADMQRAAADRARLLADSLKLEAEAQRDAAMKSEQRADAKSREAEKNLTQFLGLANESLYKIHDTIASLPGATTARKQLVATTMTYLDNVARDSGDNPRVAHMLMSGYHAMSTLLGLPRRPNLGDSIGALKACAKAEVILLRLQKSTPNDKELFLFSVGLYQTKGDILAEQGHREEANAEYLKGLGAAQRLARVDSKNPESRAQVGSMEHSLALFLMNTDPVAAAEHVRKELAVYNELTEAQPKHIEWRNAAVSSHLLLSETLVFAGRYADAVAELREAARLREGFLAESPSDVLLMRNLVVTYGRLADALGGAFSAPRNLGDTAGALENYRKSQALAEKIAAADPTDNLAQSDLATVLMRLGIILEEPSEAEESLATLRRSGTILKKLIAADPTKARDRRVLSDVEQTMGKRLERQGKTAEALAHYRAAQELTDAIYAVDAVTMANRSQVQTVYRSLAVLLAQMGQREEALQYAAKVVAQAEKFAASGPPTFATVRYLPTSYETRGMVYETLARSSNSMEDFAAAREWFTRSRDAWLKYGEIPAMRPVDVNVARISAKLASLK